MDLKCFKRLVKQAMHLHSGTADVGEGINDVCTHEVFGRICNTELEGSSPLALSDSSGRQIVFVFGSDSIESIILKHNTYECLQNLGFDREYIHYEVVEKKSKYWLVLFTKSALQGCSDIVPATWEGVLYVTKTHYPEAYEDVLTQQKEMHSTSVADFEKEAGFKFLDAKRNISGTNPSLPPFHSYKYFISLPCPRKVWQVRLFLYCELRLLSLFKGDGYTYKENGSRGTKEYLCPNLTLTSLDKQQLAVIPMNVTIPEELM